MAETILFPVTYAKGPKKNILLTLWLLLPFLVVGSLVAGIVRAYSKGPTMHARPVGQGAGDTGGANALGELLAGRDIHERERVSRDLREGHLIDPIEWPHGVRILLVGGKTGVGVVWLWAGEGGPPPERAIGAERAGPGDSGDPGGMNAGLTIEHARLREIYREGRPGAGLYVSFTESVTPIGSTLHDADGGVLEPVECPFVPRHTVREGVPIEIEVDVGRD